MKIICVIYSNLIIYLIEKKKITKKPVTKKPVTKKPVGVTKTKTMADTQ